MKEEKRGEKEKKEPSSHKKRGRDIQKGETSSPSHEQPQKPAKNVKISLDDRLFFTLQERGLFFDDDDDDDDDDSFSLFSFPNGGVPATKTVNHNPRGRNNARATSSTSSSFSGGCASCSSSSCSSSSSMRMVSMTKASSSSSSSSTTSKSVLREDHHSE